MAKLKEEQLATEVRTSAPPPEGSPSTKPKAAGLTVAQKSLHSLIAGAIKRKGFVSPPLVKAGLSTTSVLFKNSLPQ